VIFRKNKGEKLMADPVQPKTIFSSARFFIDRDVEGTLTCECDPVDDPKGLVLVRASKEKAAKNFLDNFGGTLLGTKV
jgi:hypothetical protein